MSVVREVLARLRRRSWRRLETPSEAQGSLLPEVSDDEASSHELDGVHAIVVAELWSSAAAALVAQTDSEWVLVHRRGSNLEADQLGALIAAADALGLGGACPVVLDVDTGLVREAGGLRCHRSSPPWRVLEGHPIADLPTAPFRAGIATAPIALLKRSVALQLPVGVPLEEALARTVCGIAVVPDSRSLAAGPRATLPVARELPHVDEDVEQAMATSGLVMDGWIGGRIEDYESLLARNELVEGQRAPRPRLRRSDSRERWAVRIGAPAGVVGDAWGDAPFADDLVRALERMGCRAFIDRRGAIARPESDYLDDVTLSIRGLYRMPTNPATRNVLWVISHPDWVSLEELESYDLVVAASEPWARAMDRLVSVPVRPLLQATDPGRFHPGAPVPRVQEDVLFVGRTRGIFRPIVRDAIEAGVPPAVYGDGWESFIEATHVRAQHLANAELGLAYRSAGYVLNDHWGDMAAHGFLSNRLFDAVASGARVVTDPVEGLERFEGAVRSYSSVRHLHQLLNDDEGWPDSASMSAIAARVADRDSFDARAAELTRLVAAL